MKPDIKLNNQESFPSEEVENLQQTVSQALSNFDKKNGLAKLVLTLVKLLHNLLEKQAVRRMEAGTLTDEEIENLGLALMDQSNEIKRLTKEFGLADDDLNLDLGPLGKLM
ncbi:MAG: gas vesicle protein GvpK [Parachlamydiaceae bacterium]